jgi:hypothetical protein
MEHGEGYAQEMWRELKKLRRGINVGSYENFKTNYIYVLKKLEMIEEVKREPVPEQPKWYMRRYYRIVSGKEPITNEWINPQKAWKLKKYGYYKTKKGMKSK